MREEGDTLKISEKQWRAIRANIKLLANLTNGTKMEEEEEEKQQHRREKSDRKKFRYTE